MHTGVWQESQEERNYYEDIDVGNIIILKFTSEKLDGVVFSQFIGRFLGS